jgi:hypothetical protein
LIDEVMEFVEPDGVGALQLSRSGDEVRLGRLGYQVVGVGHEAIGMNLPGHTMV